MEVRTIFSNGRTIALPGRNALGHNKIDVLTGPNGSGKTEALTSLVRAFAKLPKSSSQTVFQQLKGGDTFPEVFGEPSRVLAQTFSPFTRFPAQPQANDRLLDVYSDQSIKREPYVCLGLHKSFRGVAGQLSRRILEEALLRISEFPESTRPLFEVMRSMDFHPMLRLVYRPKQGVRKIFKNSDTDNIASYIKSKIEYDPPFLSSVANRLRRELETKSLDELVQSVSSALATVQVLSSQMNDQDPIRHHPESFALPLKFDNIQHDFFHLQAVTVLRYFDMVQLTHCELTRSNRSLPFDVANASSGEQQMLCSLFGIASAIRDESLVLIDEPELSLHPKRQIDFIEAIRALLDLVKGCHVIMSTHSPVVVQAAQSIGAGITQIGESSSVSVAPNESAPISVEQALVDVFETPVPGSAHVSNQIFKAIVSAETGSEREKNAALDKLYTLETVYGPTSDPKTRKLIQDAIGLVESAGDDSENDPETEA